VLQRLTGARINHFCYPFGRFSDAVVQIVRDAGYQTAVTTLPGVARQRDDPFRLPRVAMSGGSLLKFVAKAFTPLGDFRRFVGRAPDSAPRGFMKPQY
jgi:peptidoglycan/xylan/chitin deacetylase (PgdA/CDA1 family)